MQLKILIDIEIGHKVKNKTCGRFNFESADRFRSELTTTTEQYILAIVCISRDTAFTF